MKLQLSRRKGWRMPPNTVKVDRTTPWGNPFVTGPHGTRGQCVYFHRLLLAGNINLSTGDPDAQEKYLHYAIDNLKDLQGKNLACWCPIGAPCHADTLLIIANGWSRELRKLDASLTELRGF